MTKKKVAKSQLARIKLLLLDVDGVMTDGGIYFSEDGEEMKKFNIQDGYGIVKLQRAGVPVGLMTGRVSRMVQRRAEELGIAHVYQNLEDKIVAYRDVKSKLGLSDAEIAYVGDDEPDLQLLQIVGLSAAPADAVERVKRSVDYVCKRKGGEGAVREVVDLLLGGRSGRS